MCPIFRGNIVVGFTFVVLSPAFTDVDQEGAEAVDTVATTPTPTLELGGGGPKEGFAFGSDMKGHHRSISQHSIDRFSLQRSTDDDVSGAESDSSSSFADEVRGLTVCARAVGCFFLSFSSLLFSPSTVC